MKIIKNTKDLDEMRNRFGMNINKFCYYFGITPAQYHKWIRTGTIPKKSTKILFTIVANNPELIVDLSDIIKGIE